MAELDARGLIGQARLALDSAQTVYDAAPACFFSQQASELYLKTYLCFNGVEFPCTHNLVRLVTLCEAKDPQFSTLRADAALMEPFGVDVRYKPEAVALANRSASKVMEASWRIRAFVMERLPELREFDQALRDLR
jgi:HEPN domain-containing protein